VPGALEITRCAERKQAAVRGVTNGTNGRPAAYERIGRSSGSRLKDEAR